MNAGINLPRELREAGIMKECRNSGVLVGQRPGFADRQVLPVGKTFRTGRNYLPILKLFFFDVDFVRLVCRVASFQCRKGRSGRLTTAY